MCDEADPKAKSWCASRWCTVSINKSGKAQNDAATFTTADHENSDKLISKTSKNRFQKHIWICFEILILEIFSVIQCKYFHKF